jgi:hypothetical protein
MSEMSQTVKLISAMVLGAVAAQASPWWASWSGDSGLYPEEAGWNRVTSDPPPQRWLDDGSLFIDSRAGWGMYDCYAQARPGEMTLAPGEILHVDWRVKVDDLPPGHLDPGMAVSSDDQWAVEFLLGLDGIEDVYEPGSWAPFQAGVYHEFSFESHDLRTYTLSVDGVPSLQGVFFQSLFYSPGVGWGDCASDRSLAEWSWVECGISPEPSSAFGLLLLSCALRRTRLRGVIGAKNMEGKGHDSKDKHAGGSYGSCATSRS